MLISMLRPGEAHTTRSRRLPDGNTLLRLPKTSDFRRNALPQSVNRQTMALLDPSIRGMSVDMLQLHSMMSANEKESDEGSAVFGSRPNDRPNDESQLAAE